MLQVAAGGQRQGARRTARAARNALSRLCTRPHLLPRSPARRAASRNCDREVRVHSPVRSAGALGPCAPPPPVTQRGACAGGARPGRAFALAPAPSRYKGSPPRAPLQHASSKSQRSDLQLSPDSSHRFSSPWTPTAPAPPVRGPGPGLGTSGVCGGSRQAMCDPSCSF